MLILSTLCSILVMVSARSLWDDGGVVHMAQNPSRHNANFNDEDVVNLDKSFVREKPTGCGRMVENYRFDCYPEGATNQSACEARGCCWTPEAADMDRDKDGLGRDIKAPWCYFPTDYPSYSISQYERTKYGFKLMLSRSKPTHWPNEIMELQMDVIFEDMHRLHFKIYDPKNARYEVPIDTPPPPVRPESGLGIEFFSEPFGFVLGGGGANPIMDTSLIGAPLIFSDQFIQMSARIPGNIYGLGEHKERLLINASTGWQQRELWAHDHGPAFNTNLYGSHPFYMGTLSGGNFESSFSYGVLLLNSNAMEIDLQPMPALTFRTVGGILDFYVFYGFTPDEVIQEYTTVIGKPYLPPYWSLGFHLCRWGYHNSSNLKAVIDRNRAIGIPYDTQWTDIDYMDAHKDWTYDQKAFSELPDIVKDLHENDQKYVIIVDPGIQVMNGYTPYEEGLKMDIFIENSTGQPLVGKVWPGMTVFPDFSNPQAQEWWYNQAKPFHDKLPFDGLWTDMNEPSNFVTGSVNGCTNDNLDNPPYVPGVNGGSLQSGTLCPSAKQHLSTHYNLHSMYGHFEVKASKYVLEKLNNKRSLVISRSTFPSTGHYGGHWSGDISSTWEDLAYSIPVMLRFQMFGIPLVGADICGFLEDTTEEMCIRWMQLGAFYPFMRNHNSINTKMFGIPLVGADICGFGGQTTEELCTRWMQLGAFYPFMRNHNSLGEKDQDPAVFSKTAQDSMKTALQTRYALLPYLYSLFVNSHLKGSTVARPYFFVYPADQETAAIDEQFFWGNELLISPVLTQGSTTVKAYFNPNDTFYDITDGTAIKDGGWKTLDAPLDKINVHVKGGSIVPYQMPDVTTTKSRKKPFGLLVALGVKRIPHYSPKPPHRYYVNYTYAGGELYWDDGESLDSIENMKYNYIRFNATQNNITSEVISHGYDDPMNMKLTEIRVMGLTTEPTKVMINSKSAKVSKYKEEIVFMDFEVSLMDKLFVSWS